jgi:hypothetical protein
MRLDPFQERAYAKTASLIDALANALVARGVQPATARLAAQVGMASFGYASSRWAEDTTVDLHDLVAEAAHTVDALRADQDIRE